MNISELSKMARSYLNDQSALNRLTGFNLEYKDTDILSASRLALLEINNKYQPKMKLTINDCPEYLLLLGTIAKLLHSAISLKTRNSLTVSDGGMIVNREGNLSLYKELFQLTKAEFDMELESFKEEANIMGAW